MALNKDEKSYLNNCVATLIAENRRLMIQFESKQIELLRTAERRERDHNEAFRHAREEILAELSITRDQTLWDRVKNSFKRNKTDYSFTKKQFPTATLDA